jgi:rod shape-determining protein MreD
MPLLCLVQASLAHHLIVHGALPGIVLVVVVCWGILRGMDEGLLWAFIAGLLLDLFSGWPFGTITVSLVLTAGVVSLGRGTFMKTHALLPLFTVFTATILYFLVVLFILESTQHQVDWIAGIRDIVLPTAVYNAALTIPGFPLVRRLEERVYPMTEAKW